MIAKLPIPAAAARSLRRVIAFLIIRPSCIPHAVQRVSGAPQMRDRYILRRLWRSRVSSASFHAAPRPGHESLPVAVNPVPLLEPFALQLYELIVVRHPYFHDLRVEAFRIERRDFQRGEIADLTDHHRLTFLRKAPVEEQLG